MTDYESILTAAKSLSAAERAQLISELSDQTPTEEWPPPSPELLAEVHRRSEELARGDAKAIPWSEVREEARKQAGLDG